MISPGVPEASKPAAESRLARGLDWLRTLFRRLFYGSDEVVFDSGLPVEALAALLRRTMRANWPFFGWYTGPVGSLTRDMIVIGWAHSGQRGSVLVFQGTVETTLSGSRARGRFKPRLIPILGLIALVSVGVPALLWSAVRRPETLLSAAFAVAVFSWVIRSAMAREKRGITEHLRNVCHTPQQPETVTG